MTPLDNLGIHPHLLMLQTVAFIGLTIGLSVVASIIIIRMRAQLIQQIALLLFSWFVPIIGPLVSIAYCLFASRKRNGIRKPRE